MVRKDNAGRVYPSWPQLPATESPADGLRTKKQVGPCRIKKSQTTSKCRDRREIEAATGLAISLMGHRGVNRWLAGWELWTSGAFYTSCTLVQRCQTASDAVKEAIVKK